MDGVNICAIILVLLVTKSTQTHVKPLFENYDDAIPLSDEKLVLDAFKFKNKNDLHERIKQLIGQQYNKGAENINNDKEKQTFGFETVPGAYYEILKTTNCHDSIIEPQNMDYKRNKRTVSQIWKNSLEKLLEKKFVPYKVCKDYATGRISNYYKNIKAAAETDLGRQIMFPIINENPNHKLTYLSNKQNGMFNKLMNKHNTANLGGKIKFPETMIGSISFLPLSKGQYNVPNISAIGNDNPLVHGDDKPQGYESLPLNSETMSSHGNKEISDSTLLVKDRLKNTQYYSDGGIYKSHKTSSLLDTGLKSNTGDIQNKLNLPNMFKKYSPNIVPIDILSQSDLLQSSFTPPYSYQSYVPLLYKPGYKYPHYSFKNKTYLAPQSKTNFMTRLKNDPLESIPFHKHRDENLPIFALNIDTNKLPYNPVVPKKKYNFNDKKNDQFFLNEHNLLPEMLSPFKSYKYEPNFAVNNKDQRPHGKTFKDEFIYQPQLQFPEIDFNSFPYQQQFPLDHHNGHSKKNHITNVLYFSHNNPKRFSPLYTPNALDNSDMSPARNNILLSKIGSSNNNKKMLVDLHHETKPLIIKPICSDTEVKEWTIGCKQCYCVNGEAMCEEKEKCNYEKHLENFAPSSPYTDNIHQGEIEPGKKPMCAENTKWKMNCYQCECNNGEAICEIIENCKLRPFGEVMFCQPYSTFYLDDCYVCQCSADGVPECTIENCQRGINKADDNRPSRYWDINEDVPVTLKMGFLQNSPNKCPTQRIPICKPATRWTSNCHNCVCDVHGERHCTQIKHCKLSRKGYGEPAQCKPDTEFRRGPNELCRCHMGKLACFVPKYNQFQA